MEEQITVRMTKEQWEEVLYSLVVAENEGCFLHSSEVNSSAWEDIDEAVIHSMEWNTDGIGVR